MTAGQRLTRDQQFHGNGAVLTYQGDGNVVLYGPHGPLWASNTFTDPGYLEMQADGNLVAYDSAGTPYWASGSQGSDPRLLVSQRGLQIRASAIIWSTPPIDPGPDPDPGPAPLLPRLRVGADKRWLETVEGARFDYRDKSAFSLLGRLLRGEEAYVREYVRWARNERFTVLRVFACNPPGLEAASGPEMAGFWPALDRLVEIFAEEGMYLRLCFVAQLESFGGVWQGHTVDIYQDPVKSRCEQFCVEVASRYRDVPHLIAELFNEPVNIGLRRSQSAVIALSGKVKAVAPELLLMGGHYEDTTMCARPFDLVTVHFYRAMEVQGFNWIKRSSEYAPVQQRSQAVPMPALSGECANLGQWRKDGHNGDVVRDASASFAYGAMSRAHQYLACFHSDDGLYTDLPEPITVDHIRAFHAALDAFPMLTGNPWTGHHGHGAGDFWRDVWPPSDDIAEQWIRDGNGPWRAYGTDRFSVCFPEPKNWNWQSAAEAPMERVAASQLGDFDAAVYRRL